MNDPRTALPAGDVASLLARALDGEPGVFNRRAERGVIHFVRGRLGGLEVGPRLFAIAADGGILIRPAPEEVRDLVAQPNIGPNHALPSWVMGIADQLADNEQAARGPDAADVPQILGAPDQWVWVPIHDEHDFLKRRPIVLDSLAYARYVIDGASTPDDRD